MNHDGVDFLLSREGLAILAREADSAPTDPLREVSRLRAEGLAPWQVSALLGQAALRRRAIQKFGALASRLLFTEAGLEQATRSIVADHHATRYADAGLNRVADLGCGIGANSLALQRANREVTAVELDPLTAKIAAHNLTVQGAELFSGTVVPTATVITGDAESFPLDGVDGVFLDPARRTAGHSNTRRITDPDDYSPSLHFAHNLALRLPTGIKLGPGLDRDLIPEGVEAQWVSVDNQVVEMGLWSGPLARPGVGRSALLLATKGENRCYELSAAQDSEDAAVTGLGEYLYEPDGAVIRARLIGLLARQIGAGMLSEGIAYLSSETLTPTPFASAFRIVEVFPFQERRLKQAMRARGIGSLEIKKRGADTDPALLRKRLQLRGPHHATLIITRHGHKHVALLAERLPAFSS
ncbi:class I SAM-dependent methyltransferase [Lysinibacter sp. HNR]|uniref:class I SAM-dependent methyltransferase n=1 Tax=Lysinibacter sp. HNR TaxID=3031408 RepID=UPI0024352748|nr:class I SAM-dependent methyltransferase [Lysinibacter sp. HNR]WGD36701.1 class I SAM-dependent methyltransferase [Lysinibacter sp. HNR]